MDLSTFVHADNKLRYPYYGSIFFIKELLSTEL
mgnify:FL=1